MAGETTLTIVGNLVTDPELKYTNTGVAYTRIRLASTPRTFDKKTGTWNEGEPLFLSCTAWRDLAENLAASLTRGNRVIVTGRLRLHQWETDGQKQSMMQLDVDEIGPSLRFASATINRATRTTPAQRGSDDQWTSPTPVGAPAGSGWGGQGEEPPF